MAVVFGVAGVGKSALAFALADAWPGPVIYARVGSAGLDAAVEDACRALEVRSRELPELLAHIDEQAALWLVDDIHAADDPSALLNDCASRLRAGRLVALGRRRPQRAPSDLDRLELPLEGLGKAEARALWSHLDELYGPALGFDAAWARSRGNPFLLRRAHAGGFDDDQSLTECVSGLTGDELRLAGALALSEASLPVDVFTSLLAAERGRAALRTLVTLLVADVRGAESCTMHDLFRDAVLDVISDDLRRRLHEDLARAVGDSDVDVVSRAREVTRHLAALGRWDQACELLVSYCPALVAAGATAEALRLIGGVPPDARTDDARVALAKCKAHSLDIVGAYSELDGLIAGSRGASPDARLFFAELACVLADLDTARSAATAVAESDDAQGPLRLQAQVIAAFARACQGDGAGAVAELEDAERAEPDAGVRAKLAHARARTAWLAELHAEAEGAARSARQVLPDRTLPFDHGVQAPVALASIDARAGRFDEVDRVLAELPAPDRLDASSRLFVDRARAGIAYERGDRLEALRLLLDVDDGYQRCGHVLGSLLVRPWVARVLMAVGRRERALSLIATTRELAVRHGVGASVVALDAAVCWDPIAQLRAEPPADVAPARRGHWVRWTAIAAVQAAARSDTARAATLAAAAGQRAAGPGYGLDRTLLALSRATAARLSDDTSAVADAIREAEDCAAADVVDASLVSALFESLGHLRVVTNDAVLVSTDAEIDPGDCDVWIDARSHEVRGADQTIALTRRPVLRRLLYRLASHPNQPVPKEALIEHTWRTEYNPLRHDNLFWVNLRRLRVLIEPTGLSIDVEQGSYRLNVPERFVYVGDDEGADRARHVV